jgi:hypothetical protein
MSRLHPVFEQGVAQCAEANNCGGKTESRQPSMCRNTVPEFAQSEGAQKDNNDSKPEGWTVRVRRHFGGSCTTTFDTVFLALVLFNMIFVAVFLIGYIGNRLLRYVLSLFTDSYSRPGSGSYASAVKSRFSLALCGIAISYKTPDELTVLGMFPADIGIGGVMLAVAAGVFCATADHDAASGVRL